MHKVTVSPGKATHVAKGRSRKTLCGRRWYYLCDHGTDHYCVTCQIKLAEVNRRAEGRAEGRADE